MPVAHAPQHKISLKQVVMTLVTWGKPLWESGLRCSGNIGLSVRTDRDRFGKGLSFEQGYEAECQDILVDVRQETSITATLPASPRSGSV